VSGEGFDVAIAPNGAAAALRLADGKLALIGERPNPFQAEQWLRADGDSRDVHKLGKEGSVCDKLGCTARLADGSVVALVSSYAAFEDDCLRADLVITRLAAPASCVAPLIIDRRRLGATGAVTLRFAGDGFAMTASRSVDEDRPWSKPPRPPRAPRPPADRDAAPELPSGDPREAED